MLMRKLSLLAIAAASCAMAQPVVQAVVNGGSYSTNLAPGTWAVIYGTALAAADGSADGVSVTVGSINAPMVFVSPGQINALIPIEAASLNPGQQASLPLVVTTPAGSNRPFMVKLLRVAPAIFTQNGGGTGPALAWGGNFNALTTVGSGTIILYATGLGPSSSQGVSDAVNVFIGEQPADVAFAGPAPGLPGVYQLNVTAKGPVSNGVYLIEDGVRSNTATLPVPVGLNVTNVTGSIDGLYPTPNVAPIAFSELLSAATFQIAFDILPNAAPFTITARPSPGAGSAVIKIDPTQNTWRATLTVPTASSRQFNFLNAGVPVFDFLNNGAPFPNNVIPFTRVDPLEVEALSLLPQATSDLSGSPNATFTDSGALPAGGHFSIDSDTLGQLTNFGAFAQISRGGPGLSQTTNFQLLVDGLVVASKDITYPVD